jgi:hypothetical protein
LQVANREEYVARYNSNYAGPTCYQLWLQPRINFDGRLLGCSINYREDFGNVFEQGLTSCLVSEKMQRTKRVLMGQAPVTDDIPCSHCQVFADRQATGNWVRQEDLVADHLRMSASAADANTGKQATPSFLHQVLHRWFG